VDIERVSNVDILSLFLGFFALRPTENSLCQYDSVLLRCRMQNDQLTNQLLLNG
jgi:hypothetical protein